MKFINNFFAHRPLHIVALITSFIGHFFLVFFIGLQMIMMDPIYQRHSISKNVFQVSFLKLKTNTSEKQSLSPGEQTTKPQKPLDSPLPVLAPRLKPPSDAIHYSDSNELSEAPHFPSHLSNDLAPALIGAAPQTLSLRVQLNKSGEVEHVILGESHLSDAEQQLLVDALFNIKFEPGKVEGTSVYSEMNVEIRIDNASALPIIK